MIRANLFRRKGRTVFTLLGIAIGVAAIIALGGAAAGVRSGYEAMARGSQADLVLTQSGLLTLLSSVDESVAEQLRDWPEVSAVDGVLVSNVQAEGSAYFYIFGQDPAGFAISHFHVVKGQGLDEAEGTRAPPLILGRRAAQTLDKEVGDTFRLGDSDFYVAGIYETGNAFEEGGGLLLLQDAQTLLARPDSVSHFYVQLRDPADADNLRARVEQELPGLAVYTTAEFTDKQHNLNLVKTFSSAVIVLAVLVGGVGITNTLFMSVLERTREIGLLRAVGWRKRQVLRLILGESLALSLLGGVLGVGLGVAMTIPLRGTFTYMGMLEPQFSPSLFVLTLFVLIVLGLAGGIYPAWRASRLLPLEALRYEGGEAHIPRLFPGGMTLRNLWRRRLRTTLTLLGVGVGIMAIIAMGGIAQGYKESYTSLARGDQIDLMAIEADVSDLALSAIDEQVGARIADLPEVEAVSGIVLAVASTERLPALVLLGYDPQAFAIEHFRITEGEPLAEGDQVILGRPLAQALGLKPGDTLRVMENTYRVSGIFETGVSFEDNAAVVSLREAQKLTDKPNQVVFYGIKLQDPKQAQAVRDQLNATFTEIEVSLSSEFAENLPDVEQMEQGTQGISFLVAIVGIAGMLNTMLLSVLERTREIGVLRALGWRRRQVLGMILREALALGTVGGILGILLGLALAWGFAQIPVLGGVLISRHTPRLFVQALVVALVAGAAGGLYPAWRATRLQPVEALRYE